MKVSPNSKLTPQRHKRIVELVTAGNYGSTAAVATGIAYGTYKAWMQKGRRLNELIQDDPEIFKKGGGISEMDRRCLALYADVTRGRAEAETHAVACLRAGFKDPRMAVEYLKRACGDRWYATSNLNVKKQRVRATAQSIAEEFASMSDEELAASIAEDNVQQGKQSTHSAPSTQAKRKQSTHNSVVSS